MANARRFEAGQLKPAQQLALGALARIDATDLTRARYQEFTGVSRSQAAYDLAELVEAGLLVRIGAGRATRYHLPPANDSGRRRWTDGRIRTELSAFCSDRVRRCASSSSFGTFANLLPTQPLPSTPGACLTSRSAFLS